MPEQPVRGGLKDAKTMLYQAPEKEEPKPAAEPAKQGGGMAATMLLNADSVPQPIQNLVAAGMQAPGGHMAGGAPGLDGWVGNWKPGVPSHGGQQPGAGVPARKKGGKGKLILIIVLIFLALGVLAGAAVGVFLMLSSNSEGAAETSSSEGQPAPSLPATPAPIPVATPPAAMPTLPPQIPAVPSFGASGGALESATPPIGFPNSPLPPPAAAPTPDPGL